MANVKQYLEQILKARFGKDVRQSIHDSIDAINTQVTESEAGIVESATAAQRAAENAGTAASNAQQVLTDTLAAQAAAEAAAINAEAINADLVQNVSDLSESVNGLSENVTQLNDDLAQSVSNGFISRNIFDINKYIVHSSSVNQSKWYVENDKLYLNDNYYATRGMWQINLDASKEYVFSFKTSIETGRVYVELNGKNGRITYADVSTSYEYKISNQEYLQIILTGRDRGTIATVYDIQLELGNKTEYTKYAKSNVELTKDVDVIGTTTNMLNPTLQSQVVNGVTVTNNGDGTYTLNTTDKCTGFTTLALCNVQLDGIKRITGCPNEDNILLACLYNGSWIFNQKGEGINWTFSKNEQYGIYIVIFEGAVLKNVVVRPMITNNLSATNDDFVPFTGTTGKLNGDVAEIAKKFILDKAEDITFAYDSGNIGITFKVSNNNYRRIYLNNSYIIFAQSTDGSTWTNIWVK